MATTGKVIGNNIRLFIEIQNESGEVEVEIGCAESGTLNYERDMAVALCKDDDFVEDVAPTVKRWTLDVSGFIVYSNPFNVEEIFDILQDGKLVKIRFSTTSAGDIELTGDGYISTLSQEAGTVDFATYSFTVRSSTDLTKGTVV